LPFTAFIQMRCVLDRCLLKTTQAEDFPGIVEIHRLSGRHCTMLKVRAAWMAHFEGLVERLGEHAELDAHVVLSTPYEGRPIAPEAIQHRPVSRASGWSCDWCYGLRGIRCPGRRCAQKHPSTGWVASRAAVGYPG
jgi:Lrp/AsnC family transcriptional regulator, leucine-responsive regulatory protein